MFDITEAAKIPIYFTPKDTQIKEELAMLYMQGKVNTHMMDGIITFTETVGKNTVAVMIDTLPEDKQV